jgi:chitinase
VAAYGRTWTLADPSRSGLGAKTKSVGPAGSCTGERGILAWSEIRRIIASGNAQVGRWHACHR